MIIVQFANRGKKLDLRFLKPEVFKMTRPGHVTPRDFTNSSVTLLAGTLSQGILRRGTQIHGTVLSF